MEISINPYFNRAMIRDINDFYGREKEVARIYSRIRSAHPQSVSIVGARRIGKSSLLNFIYQEQNRQKYLKNNEQYKFIFIDFQERKKISLPEFFGTLFDLLSTELHQQVRIQETPSYEGFKNVMARIQQEGLKLILLFDEFDSITQNLNFDMEFFAFLRALANRYDVAYIMSSGRHLQTLCHTREIADSPFFNIFASLYLGVFTINEAKELITLPSKSAGIPLEEHTDFLLDVGGIYPFFLQIACCALFEYLQNEDTLDDIGRKEVCENIMEEAEPHLEYIWGRMDEIEHQICQHIASGKRVDERELSTIRNLVKQGYVLENQDGLKMFSSLFTKWILESSMKISSGKGEYAPEAIVVIDICGSSRIADIFGAHRLRMLYEELEEIALEVATLFHHRYHRTTGDGVLLTFYNIIDAVNASLEIQKRIQDHNATLDADHHIPIRFSIHFGETLVDEQGNRHGPTVNMAFRVESLDVGKISVIPPVPLENYIIVTEHIASELVSIQDIQCRELGTFELDGFTGLHRIYETSRISVPN
jgi:class 3 adenylate cyclase